MVKTMGFKAEFNFSTRDLIVMMGENNLLVITVTIKEYEVRKIFIDQGSYADIMFWSLYEKLGLEPKDLQQYNGSLVGFTGDTINPKGYVKVNVGFGKKPHQKIVKVMFLLIDCLTVYNPL
jgi:hypothetical protein